MKKSILLLAVLLSALFTFAQPPTPPSNLAGHDLRSWLKSNWFDGLHNQLGYTVARRSLYNYIDNHNNQIVDVYSGYVQSWTYGGTGTNPYPINCEHTIPQSYFNYNEPMKSDLHHLFPVHGSVNSSRSNNPFAEIEDYLTSKWWRNGSSQTSIPITNLDEHSEYYGGTFEPREDHKGDAARAIFYFYTMYPTQAGNISQIGDLQTLYTWHLNDPVDIDEIIRNGAIESYQGDRNPYIDHPEWVALAWGLTPMSQYLFFSEYVEGSSYNKALELVNLTGASVDFSGYSIRKQTNGGGNWTSGLSLNGTLAAGETYVVAHNSAASGLSQHADLLTGNSALTFNGNDPIGLFYNGTLIDVIGDFNGGSANFAQNVTLRRQLSVTAPNSTYTPIEWDHLAVNTFSDIGEYGTSKSEFAPSEMDLEAVTYPSPFKDRVSLQLSKDWHENPKVDIINAQGQLVWQGQFSGTHELTIDAQSFASGIYLVQIHSNSQRIQKRIVKQ